MRQPPSASNGMDPYRELFERSADAITAFRPFERHLGAVTVAVPADRVAEVHELLSCLAPVDEDEDGPAGPVDS